MAELKNNVDLRNRALLISTGAHLSDLEVKQFASEVYSLLESIPGTPSWKLREELDDLKRQNRDLTLRGISLAAELDSVSIRERKSARQFDEFKALAAEESAELRKHIEDLGKSNLDWRKKVDQLRAELHNMKRLNDELRQELTAHEQNDAALRYESQFVSPQAAQEAQAAHRSDADIIKNLRQQCTILRNGMHTAQLEASEQANKAASLTDRLQEAEESAIKTADELQVQLAHVRQQNDAMTRRIPRLEKFSDECRNRANGLYERVKSLENMLWNKQKSIEHYLIQIEELREQVKELETVAQNRQHIIDSFTEEAERLRTSIKRQDEILRITEEKTAIAVKEVQRLKELMHNPGEQSATVTAEDRRRDVQLYDRVKSLERDVQDKQSAITGYMEECGRLRTSIQKHEGLLSMSADRMDWQNREIEGLRKEVQRLKDALRKSEEKCVYAYKEAERLKNELRITGERSESYKRETERMKQRAETSEARAGLAYKEAEELRGIMRDIPFWLEDSAPWFELACVQRIKETGYIHKNVIVVTKDYFQLLDHLSHFKDKSELELLVTFVPR